MGPGEQTNSEDGSTWSVNQDWEERTGLVHNIFTLTPSTDDTDSADALEARFAAEPLFL